jgi:hypothetical protein
MTTKLFEEAVEVDMSKRTVTLPKVCCWYLSDFAPHNRSSAGSAGSQAGPQAVPHDCLRVLVHYFKRDEKDKIIRLLLESTPPNVKFRSFNYRCRMILPEDAVRSGGVQHHTSTGGSLPIQDSI